jgi:prevent-host-death family protein
MGRSVTATEAKAKLLSLLDQASAGEEIEITRHGRPVARLVPAVDSRSLRGSLEGIASSVAPEEEIFSTGQVWRAS